MSKKYKNTLNAHLLGIRRGVEVPAEDRGEGVLPLRLIPLHEGRHRHGLRDPRRGVVQSGVQVGAGDRNRPERRVRQDATERRPVDEPG